MKQGLGEERDLSPFHFNAHKHHITYNFCLEKHWGDSEFLNWTALFQLSPSALWLNLPKRAGDFQYLKLKSLTAFERNMSLLEKPLWDRTTIYLLNQLKKLYQTGKDEHTQTHTLGQREMFGGGGKYEHGKGRRK